MKKSRRTDILTILLTALSVVSSLACRTERNQSVIVHDSLAQASLLSDQGRHEEAGALLAGELALNPHNVPVRIALSSTYMAILGIDATTYFQLSHVYMNYESADIAQFIKSYEHILKQIKPAGPDSYSAADLVRQYLMLAQSVEIFLRLFKALPTLSNEQIVWVEKAYSVLQYPLPASPRGPFFYRALLQLMLFKYKWDHGYYFASQVSCQQFGVALDEGLNRLQKDFSLIRADLQAASQSGTADFDRVEEYLRTLVSLIKTGLHEIQGQQSNSYHNRELAEALFSAFNSEQQLDLSGVVPCTN